MIGILLTILKVIGIALLCILGLIILLILIVLLVPVRYFASVAGDTRSLKDASAEVKVSFLLHLVRFRLSYERGMLRYRLSVLFFKLLGEEAQEENEAETETKIEDNDTTVPSAEKQSEEKKRPEKVEPEVAQSKETKPKEQQPEEKQPKEKPKKEKPKKEKREEEKSGIKETLTRVLEFLKKPENKHAFHLTKEELLYLLKHYLPKTCKGHLTFSAGRPDTTGKLLGALSLFPVFYANGMGITPDFESEGFYVAGDLKVKGHIRLVHLLKSALKLLFSKEWRGMIKEIRTLTE